MKKIVSKRVIFLLVMALIILLSNTIAAKGEVKVSGVTAYTIYRAPLKESKNLSISYLPYKNYAIPSCYEVHMNGKAIEKFMNAITIISNKYESDRHPAICGNSRLIYTKEDIMFTYDGYWLIGQKKVTPRLGQNSTLPLNEAGDRVDAAWNDIYTVYEEFRDKKHPFHNLTQTDTARKGDFLRIVHFSSISPPKLSVGKDTGVEGEYTILRNLSAIHGEAICTFLGYDERECKLLVVEYITKQGDKKKSWYVIRNNDNVGDLYGTIIFINDLRDLDTTATLEHLFSSLDYLRYGREIVVESYGSDLKDNSTLLHANIKDIKRELLNKTDNNHFDYNERLRYLESNRSIILEKNVDAIREIESELYLIKRYYGRVYTLFLSLPFSRTFGPLLYDSEIESHLGDLSAIIGDIKENTRLINELQWETTQLYYSELDSARTEKAIRETHDDNLIMTSLALLSAILAIMFALIIVPIQNAADKYTYMLLDEFKRDWRIWLVFTLIISLMGSLLYFWITKASLEELYIGIVFMISFLVLAYLYLYTINQINPTNIIKWIKNSAIKEKDKDKIKEKIRSLTSIAIKFDFHISEKCISALEEIAIERIREDPSISSKDVIDFISAQLRFIGVTVARDPIKQTYVSYVIDSLCTIGSENIKNVELENKESHRRTIVNIRHNIRQIGDVFEEMIQNKKRSNITNDEIEWILSSLYNFAEVTLKNKLLEEQSKQILDLIRHVAFESKQIPRVDHEEVLRGYKDDLYHLQDTQSVSEDLKNKIGEIYDEATNKIAHLTK